MLKVNRNFGTVILFWMETLENVCYCCASISHSTCFCTVHLNYVFDKTTHTVSFAYGVGHKILTV